MKEYQITCINKPHHDSPHEHITHIGNQEEKWRVTRERAVRLIEEKVCEFYTVDHKGKKCSVGIMEKNGKKFLRTHADGEWNDNLLAQPECTDACAIGEPGNGLAGKAPTGPVDLRGGGRHG